MLLTKRILKVTMRSSDLHPRSRSHVGSRVSLDYLIPRLIMATMWRLTMLHVEGKYPLMAF